MPDVSRGSLKRKNTLMLVFLGIFLLLGTGLAAGVQLYRQNLAIYKEMAYSYVEMANINIDGDQLKKIIENGDAISEIDNGLQEAEAGRDWDTLQKISSNLQDDPTLYSLYSYWENIDWFIFSGGNTSASAIRYFYVVIPTEEDLIYVWDSDATGAKYTRALEHDTYSPGEKENLMKAYRGEWDDSLAIYREKNEILGTAMRPIRDAEGNILAVCAVDVSITGIRESFFRLLLHIAIAITVILMVVGTVYFAFLRKQVILPIVELEKATRNLVSDLETGAESSFHVNVHTRDEIEALANAFEEMEVRLKEYIAENAQITAEKERIGTELELATRIQADMLPNIFPPFPERREFDIYASMTPAKEVGGDFYDFFLIDEDHLGLVMADVSGKGIPAALFMMMSKIMIQNLSLAGQSPKEVLETVNEQICRNNREQMFVTVWLGVLEISTGRITAVNAGHEYPILKNPDGSYELVKDKHGFVIGGMEGIRYREYEMELAPGASLFLYTDGLPEANNEKEEMFGTGRVLDTLNRKEDAAPGQLLSDMSRAVQNFAGGAAQFDDLTMLCLKYYGTDV